MPPTWLPVPWHKQQQEADCLAACVSMVLAFWKRPLAYDKILRLLQTTIYGTVARHVHHLSTIGVNVIYTEGELPELYAFIDQQIPVITLVKTGELPYWPHDTMHAVVVVGYNQQFIFVNDPSFEPAPLTIATGDFDLAWLEMGNRYVVIRP